MSALVKILLGLVVAAVVVTVGIDMAHKQPSVATATSMSQTTAPATTTSAMAATSSATVQAKPAAVSGKATMAQLVLLTNDQWKNILTPDQYAVLREDGTEQPFTSPLLHETRKGTFVTADCGEPVFRSETKFDSGTGWPSFYAPIPGSVVIKTDNSYGMTREEVETPVCHSHLGHLFHDAPQTPTGDRYCINGVALKFIPDLGQ